MAKRFGLKRSTHKREPLAEPPAVLQRMDKSELHLMIESSLMNAQQKLSIYRNSPTEDRPGALLLLQDDITMAFVGSAELLARYTGESTPSL